MFTSRRSCRAQRQVLHRALRHAFDSGLGHVAPPREVKKQGHFHVGRRVRSDTYRANYEV
jgi:hypothetical protein